MKKYLLILVFVFINLFAAFSQDSAPFNIPKPALKEPVKIQELIDRIHFAIKSGKFKCYKPDLKEPYSRAEASILGSKSMTIDYKPNPEKEPDRVEFKDSITPFLSKNIIGYGVKEYKVKVPVKQEELNKTPVEDKNKNAGKKKEKVKKNDKNNKTASTKQGNSKNEKEIRMQEETRYAFAPYLEEGEYIYWIRFDDLPVILTEQEIGLLKKDLIRSN